MTDDSDHAPPARKAFFALHVGAFIAAALALGFGFGESSASAFITAGLLFVTSGGAAFIGGKSLLLPKSPVVGTDPVDEARRRRAMEQISAWIVGFLFGLLGLVITVLGIRAAG